MSTNAPKKPNYKKDAVPCPPPPPPSKDGKILRADKYLEMEMSLDNESENEKLKSKVKMLELVLRWFIDFVFDNGLKEKVPSEIKVMVAVALDKEDE